MSGGEGKAWRVTDYNPATDIYQVEYCKGGVRQCWFLAKRDNRNECFWLIFEGRVPYGEIPKARKVYFDMCKWEI